MLVLYPLTAANIKAVLPIFCHINYLFYHLNLYLYILDLIDGLQLHNVL